MKRFPFSRYGKKNKFGAKRSRCVLDHDHRSGLESEYCGQLRMLEQAGEIKSFEFERFFKLRVNGRRICGIKPDFLIHYKDGRVEIHECKGIEMPDWKIKWELMQALHPEFNYQVIK